MTIRPINSKATQTIQKDLHTGKPVRVSVMAHQDLGQVGIVPALVPDATYQMGFVRAETGKFKNRERWFLWFQIVTPGDYFGTELYHSCPYPKKGGKHFGLSSNLVAAATIALGQRPKRRDRITTRIFEGKVFLANTRTVTLDQDGKQRHAGDHYSVIEKLLSLEAGASII